MFDDLLNDILPEGWETDGDGIDGSLTCPHGHLIELDGECPEGCRSPLLAMGLI